MATTTTNATTTSNKQKQNENPNLPRPLKVMIHPELLWHKTHFQLFLFCFLFWIKQNLFILITNRGPITGIWWNTSQSTSPHHKAETVAHNTLPVYLSLLLLLFFLLLKKKKKIPIRVRGKITGIWWNTSQSTSPHHKAETMSHNTPPIYFNSSFFLVFCFCCCLFVCLLLLFWGGRFF